MWTEQVGKHVVRRLHPLALAYMAYEDAVLLRWGIANGICTAKDVSNVEGCVRRAARTFVRLISPVVEYRERCHYYLHEPKSCLVANGVKYDGHIMYVETGENEVQLLSHLLIIQDELKPPDSLAKYLYIAQPEFFTTGILTERYGVFYMPTKTAIIVRYVSLHTQYVQAIYEHKDEAVQRILETAKTVFYSKTPWKKVIYPDYSS